MIAWLLLAQLQGPPATVVLFSGSWCGACAAMEPVWKTFVAENPRLRCVYVDVDREDSPEYRRYRKYWEEDRQMPQLIWVDGQDRLVQRKPGFTPLSELRRLSR